MPTNYISNRFRSTGRLDTSLTRGNPYRIASNIYRDNGRVTRTNRRNSGRALARDLAQLRDEEISLSDFLDLRQRLPQRLSDTASELMQERGGFYCEFCSTWQDQEADGTTWFNDSLYCPNCAEAYLSCCDDCGETCEESDTTSVNGEVICSSCINRTYCCCDRCSRYVASDDSVCVNDDYRYCERCADRCTHYCDSSGCNRTNDNPCDDLACSDCEDYRPEPTWIYDYNETFTKALAPIPDNKLLNHVLGLELELEANDTEQFAITLGDKYSREICHCKRDGSLDSEYGVEVVTGYGVLDKLLPIATTIANLARTQFDGKSHKGDSCGLHISLDRSQFSSALQARIIVFWNSAENYPLLRQFTRRDYRNLSYCSIKREKANADFLAYPELQSSEKYEIVNTRHRSHLEFRGFRGSLLPLTLEACLSLVSLIASYCETATTVAQLAIGPFLDWLDSQVVETDCRRKAVIAYLANRNRSLAEFRPIAPPSYPEWPTAPQATPVGQVAYPEDISLSLEDSEISA